MYTPRQIHKMDPSWVPVFLRALKLPLGLFSRSRIIIELAKQDMIMDVYSPECIRGMDPTWIPKFLHDLPTVPAADTTNAADCPREQILRTLRYIGAIPGLGSEWLHTVPGEHRILMVVLNDLFNRSPLDVIKIVAQAYSYHEIQEICKATTEVLKDDTVTMPEAFRAKLGSFYKVIDHNDVFWKDKTMRDFDINRSYSLTISNWKLEYLRLMQPR